MSPLFLPLDLVRSLPNVVAESVAFLLFLIREVLVPNRGPVTMMLLATRIPKSLQANTGKSAPNYTIAASFQPSTINFTLINLPLDVVLRAALDKPTNTCVSLHSVYLACCLSMYVTELRIGSTSWQIASPTTQS